MQLKEFEVSIPQAVSQQEMPEGKITIAPVGDVHLQPKLMADRALKEHLKWIEGEYENVWYVGMGDYVDLVSGGNRQMLRGIKLHDSARRQFDEIAKIRVDEFVEIFRHTENRWLGMLDGHHSWEFSEGDTSDDVIRDALVAPSLGYCADIEIRFMRPNGAARGITNIWCHHGHGGRKYPIGKLADLAGHFPKNDVFLMGHYHKTQFDYYPRIIRVGQTNISRTALLAVTGGWLKQYTPHVDDYVERLALPPRGIGGLVFTIEPGRAGPNREHFIPKFNVIAPSY